jgi:hypothetical protein
MDKRLVSRKLPIFHHIIVNYVNLMINTVTFAIAPLNTAGTSVSLHNTGFNGFQ